MKIDANNFFSALSNEIRLRCLILLQFQGELCVCELTYALNLSQPMISRHLAYLREAGILVARRNGTWMYYRINPELPEWMQLTLQTTLDGVRKTEPFVSDRKMLESMTNRPELACNA